MSYILLLLINLKVNDVFHNSLEYEKQEDSHLEEMR